MKKVDLNCDMAEWSPTTGENFDEKIMPYISSCNIACGFHSGSPVLIDKTITAALAHGVKIGAHPSYNDAANFGRISLRVNPSILRSELRYQIGAVKSATESLGGKLHHVKPHGALYNDLVHNEELAQMFVDLILQIDPNLKVYGLSGSDFGAICTKGGIEFVNEAFADRRYDHALQLRSRKYEDAVLDNEKQVIEQIAMLTKGQVALQDETVVNLQVDSICLHSDTKGAVSLSKAIHKFIRSKNITIG